MIQTRRRGRGMTRSSIATPATDEEHSSSPPPSPLHKRRRRRRCCYLGADNDDDDGGGGGGGGGGNSSFARSPVASCCSLATDDDDEDEPTVAAAKHNDSNSTSTTAVPPDVLAALAVLGADKTDRLAKQAFAKELAPLLPKRNARQVRDATAKVLQYFETHPHLTSITLYRDDANPSASSFLRRQLQQVQYGKCTVQHTERDEKLSGEDVRTHIFAFAEEHRMLQTPEMHAFFDELANYVIGKIPHAHHTKLNVCIENSTLVHETTLDYCRLLLQRRSFRTYQHQQQPPSAFVASSRSLL